MVNSPLIKYKIQELHFDTGSNTASVLGGVDTCGSRCDQVLGVQRGRRGGWFLWSVRILWVLRIPSRVRKTVQNSFTHTSAHIHTRMHTQALTLTCACTCVHTHSCIRTHSRTHAYTYYTQTHTHELGQGRAKEGEDWGKWTFRYGEIRAFVCCI